MSTTANLLRPPELSLRWIPVWRRNLLVWKKLAIASVLTRRRLLR
jgi:lipooligosaccharide transport system permease protein